MTVRTRNTRSEERGTEDGTKKRSPSGLFEKAFNGGETMFSQALDMLKSDRMDDRLRGMATLLRMVVDGDEPKAKKKLFEKCEKAIASEELDERKAVRKVLCRLASLTDCDESKRMMEDNYLQTIQDLDLDALVFLGMHGPEDIGGEVDTVLEGEFSRITGMDHVDVMTYIATLSKCSLDVKMEASKIAGMELLKSDRMEDRLKGMGLLLNVAIEGDDPKAKKELLDKCRKAIASEEIDERKAVRKVLGQLAMKADCAESKGILERDYLQTIHDFDLGAIVFLGMYAKENLSSEVDAVLEAQFDRITGRQNLDTIAYIAAMSKCSIGIRRKAAEIAAKSDNRAGNLAYIRDTCNDEVISGLMVDALKDRGVDDAEGSEENLPDDVEMEALMKEETPSDDVGEAEAVKADEDVDSDNAGKEEADAGIDQEDEDVHELDFDKLKFDTDSGLGKD
jgi:hypothetical protein